MVALRAGSVDLRVSGLATAFAAATVAAAASSLAGPLAALVEAAGFGPCLVSPSQVFR
jgi:hypothetical protein